jgi:hypothetical protein
MYDKILAMKTSRQNFIATVLMIVSLLAVAGLAFVQGPEIKESFAKVGWQGIGIIFALHIVYMILSAEIWLMALKADRADTTRHDIYISVFFGAALSILSTPLGLALQTFLYSKLNRKISFFETGASMVPVVWAKLFATMLVVVFASFAIGLPAYVAAIVLVVLALSIFLLAKLSNYGGALRGLAAAHNPYTLFKMSILGGLIVAVQVFKYEVALNAVGVQASWAEAALSSVAGSAASSLPIGLIAAPSTTGAIFTDSQALNAALVIPTGSLIASIVAVAIIVPLLIKALRYQPEISPS